MDGDDVRMVAVVCRGFLAGALHDADAPADFSAVSPTMRGPVAGVVGHVATTLLWYAADLAAGPQELSTMQLSLRADASPADLVRTLETNASVLAAVIDASPPGHRGWHDWGRPDASGMAGMGCDEMLVHTHDVALGLGRAFVPPTELARRTVHRLFPWAPVDADPWTALLWANGRADLPGHPHQDTWRWHCSPLEEWDGTTPGA